MPTLAHSGSNAEDALNGGKSMSNNEEPRPVVRKRIRTTPWTLGAMAVAGVYTTITALRDGDHGRTHFIADDIGYGIGSHLISGLFIAFVGYVLLYFLVLKRARAGGIHYFVALLGTVILCGTAVTVFNGQRTKPVAQPAEVVQSYR